MRSYLIQGGFCPPRHYACAPQAAWQPKQNKPHHRDTEARSVIRLLDFLPSPHRVLRAFGPEVSATCGSVFGGKRSAYFRAKCTQRLVEREHVRRSLSVPSCLCGESPLVFPPRRVRFGRKHFLVFPATAGLPMARYSGSQRLSNLIT